MIEQDIVTRAKELGLAGCGIIRAEAMQGFIPRLEERIERIPGGDKMWGWMRMIADVRAERPWVNSVVVAVNRYGHYRIPPQLRGLYATGYLTDLRFNPQSPDNQRIETLGKYLDELGLRVASDVHPGLVAMRWAAEEAGLGIMRQNNFFYTLNDGSYVRISAWLVDREMELIAPDNSPECPEDCGRCSKACPTDSLCAPYTMNMSTCVSRLTTNNAPDLYTDKTNEQIGCWIYGCDECQDACPFNKGKQSDEEDFPGLEELSKSMLPEDILRMDYSEIQDKLSTKFFYIKEDSLWRWKVDALNSLANSDKEKAAAFAQTALGDSSEYVREKAKRVISV